MNVGLVLLREGQVAKAAEWLQRAQTIRLAHLGDDEPPGLKMQGDLGKGYYSLALAQLALGDLDLAEKNLTTAAEAFERLQQLDPQDMQITRQFAICYRMLGDVKASSGAVDEAVAAYGKSLQTLQTLCMRNPDVPEYSADMAGVLMNLGLQQQLAGNGDAALENMQKAVDVLHRLAGQFETMPRYRRDLGAVLRAVGTLHAEANHTDQARENYEESKTILQQLVREHPASSDYTSELGRTLEALEALEEAIKL